MVKFPYRLCLKLIVQVYFCQDVLKTQTPEKLRTQLFEGHIINANPGLKIYLIVFLE